MTPGSERSSTSVWYGKYLSHLTNLSGFGVSGRRPDTGALAELRAVARGRRFELRALRHVVPYIEDDAGSRPYRIRVALVVGQLYASYPPTAEYPSDEDTSAVPGRTIGRCLGTVDARIEAKGSKDENRSVTPLERHLQMLVASSLDDLPRKLRGTLSRLSSQGITLTTRDYGRLLRDLTFWNDQQKRVQYQWVQDFYSNKNNSHPEGNE